MQFRACWKTVLAGNPKSTWNGVRSSLNKRALVFVWFWSWFWGFGGFFFGGWGEEERVFPLFLIFQDRFFAHLRNRSFLYLSLRWTGVAFPAVSLLSYLSQISFLNFRSCPWVIHLITNVFVSYTGLKANWVQTRKALLILPQEFAWHLSWKCF